MERHYRFIDRKKTGLLYFSAMWPGAMPHILKGNQSSKADSLSSEAY